MSESKIVFRDGEQTRCIRGIITDQDDFFITLRRHDGTLKLNKECILKIENWEKK